MHPHISSNREQTETRDHPEKMVRTGNVVTLETRAPSDHMEIRYVDSVLIFKAKIDLICVIDIASRDLKVFRDHLEILDHLAPL